MLSIQTSYINYEADEIQSSSSSSLSFENSDRSFSNNYYYNHFKENNNIMTDPHQEQQQQQIQQHELAFNDSDWSISKSPQPSFIHQRDDLYSPVAATSSFYEYQLPMTHHEPVYQPIHWSSSNTNSMINTPIPRSPDFFLPSRKQQQFSNTTYPLPPPSPITTMFSQRPNLVTVQKGERYHPRFKSANARLSPYTEQQGLYQHLLTTSSSSPPQHYHPLMEEQVMLKEDDKQAHQQQPETQFFQDTYHTKQEDLIDQTLFQIDVVLHASTAVKKKQDEKPVTYLNRSQAYPIDLSAISQPHGQANTMTSTVSIAFHEPGHRQIAENYWKYWISQQEFPKEARAIGLDTNQTTGVYNIRHVSFDRVSFDWNSRFGAKVYVRFNCLSTDFSRIKGVKGIPLRCVMETKVNYMTLPDDSLLYKGIFTKEQDSYQYKESCYCKIKLFRDKGAERKNKDDKKQMAKQMEKVIASTNGNPQQHPLWPIISQSHQSTSTLSQVPTSPDIIPHNFDDITSDQLLNIMAPLPLMNETTKRKRTGKHKAEYTKKLRRDSCSALTFYVWTRHIHNSPHEIVLEQSTTDILKSKLGQVLSIHPARISEILWKRKSEQSQDNVLVLVEDTFINEHISNGEMMTVDLEIKADGNLRLVLEF